MIKDFRKTLSFLKEYKKTALLNVLFNVLAAIFNVVSLLTLKPFLDILFLEKYEANITASSGVEGFIAQFNAFLVTYITAHGKEAGLVAVCGIVLALFFLKNLFRYLAQYVVAELRFGIEFSLRQAIMDTLLKLPFSYFSDERKGDLMSRMTVDVGEIQWSILQSLETLVRAPLTMFLALSVMLYISPSLTGVSFLLMLVVAVVIGGVGKTLRRKSTSVQESQGRLLSILEEALNGLRIIRAFNAESYQSNYFRAENDFYFREVRSIIRRRDLASPLTEFLGIGIVVLLLLYGGELVFAGDFEASTFVTFAMMFYSMIAPAKSFSTAYYAMQKGAAAAKRINEILDTPEEIEDRADAKSIAELSDKIRIEELSFAYERDTQVLKNLSFEVNKGETVALVGPSGAGKSTIIDLIPRFYDPQGGRICIDGEDIRNYKLEDLRNLIGFVGQEAILFNDSIYNNIVFGLEDVSKEQVVEAAKMANAHDFILAAEQGYETNIGDHGSKLSGGQRQRLTIARALLRAPQILILDEATASLDAESEHLVQEALNNLMKDRTSIVIAHRLSTIQYANKILVLQEGEIVEQGTDRELRAMNGLYSKLLELQKI